MSKHHVTVVPSIEDARQAIVAKSFDLILSDYDLDDGKGDEFVRECRAKDLQLPIIAASSHEAGNAALMAAGATEICSKMEFARIAGIIERIDDNSSLS